MVIFCFWNVSSWSNILFQKFQNDTYNTKGEDMMEEELTISKKMWGVAGIICLLALSMFIGSYFKKQSLQPQLDELAQYQEGFRQCNQLCNNENKWGYITEIETNSYQCVCSEATDKLMEAKLNGK